MSTAHTGHSFQSLSYFGCIETANYVNKSGQRCKNKNTEHSQKTFVLIFSLKMAEFVDQTSRRFFHCGSFYFTEYSFLGRYYIVYFAKILLGKWWCFSGHSFGR